MDIAHQLLDAQLLDARQQVRRSLPALLLAAATVGQTAWINASPIGSAAGNVAFCPALGRVLGIAPAGAVTSQFTSVGATGAIAEFRALIAGTTPVGFNTAMASLGTSVICIADDRRVHRFASGAWTGTGVLSPVDIAATTEMTSGPLTGVVLFGGVDGTGLFSSATRQFNGTTIVTVPTTGAPSPRGASAICALPSGNLLMYGGLDATTVFDETWILNTATMSWTQVATPVNPGRRYFCSLSLDTRDGVAVLSGDVQGLGRRVFTFNETQGALGAWTDTGLDLPAGFGGTRSAYDPLRSEVVIVDQINPVSAVQFGFRSITNAPNIGCRCALGRRMTLTVTDPAGVPVGNPLTFPNIVSTSPVPGTVAPMRFLATFNVGVTMLFFSASASVPGTLFSVRPDCLLFLQPPLAVAGTFPAGSGTLLTPALPNSLDALGLTLAFQAVDLATPCSSNSIDVRFGR